MTWKIRSLKNWNRWREERNARKEWNAPSRRRDQNMRRWSKSINRHLQLPIWREKLCRALFLRLITQYIENRLKESFLSTKQRKINLLLSTSFLLASSRLRILKSLLRSRRPNSSSLPRLSGQRFRTWVKWPLTWLIWDTQPRDRCKSFTRRESKTIPFTLPQNSNARRELSLPTISTRQLFSYHSTMGTRISV